MEYGSDRIAVIIEDDGDIRRLLETVLEQAGFETRTAGTGLEGIEQVRRFGPILTTLDVNLPGIDGFETAKRIRRLSDTYLIMLSARNDEIDALLGLEAGADDYIAKPFRPRELRARIDAMLRRPRSRTSDEVIDGSVTRASTVTSLTASQEGAHTLETERASRPDPTGSLSITTDLGTRRAVDSVSRSTITAVPPSALVPPSSREAPWSDDGWLEHRGLRLQLEMHLAILDGAELDLTRSEFVLLAALMSSGRRVRSKDSLTLALRGDQYFVSDHVSDADKRTIEVHVTNLRRKLGENATQPRWIETVRGVGYRMTAVGGA